MALQVLFRLGSTGAAGSPLAGFKSLFAFWMGGAGIPSTTPQPTPTGGGHLWDVRDLPRRGRRLRRVVEEQRKRWHEVLRQAERAQQAALDRAGEVEANESLREAAEAAQDAINAAREAEAGQAALEKLVKSLQAAAKAKSHRAMVEKALKAEREARELELRYLDFLMEMDDEEALTLLM